ncbi:unnamed protein product [Echinostoma caproni]|uniref:Late endosomal/lysosomal adaptor and MAPK and MTOR activator 1 n=1 Tax=Echinostoma caproni TaxID=27848 RepID=A0A183A2Z2_9TREM|nr:unnamed protein product [Echinostoma caproni]
MDYAKLESLAPSIQCISHREEHNPLSMWQEFTDSLQQLLASVTQVKVVTKPEISYSKPYKEMDISEGPRLEELQTTSECLHLEQLPTAAKTTAPS